VICEGGRGAVLAAIALCGGCGRISFDALVDGGGGARDAAPDARKFFIDGGECPPGYTFDTLGCYRAYNDVNAPKTWFEAEADCEADAFGAHLVVIDSVAEAGVVDRQQPGTIIDHWIGMTDLVTEDAFLNVDNRPSTYLMWDAGEPVANDDCVLFQDDQTLRMKDCTVGDDYVCEYDGIPPVSSAWGQ
jgi:hypothetical protein